MLKQIKKNNNKTIDKNVVFKEKTLQDLAETGNNIFESLRDKFKMTKRSLSMSLLVIRRLLILRKVYLLPKIHKKLFNVPGRPVLSNCGSPTEKVLGFLESHPKGIVRKLVLYKRFESFYK